VNAFGAGIVPDLNAIFAVVPPPAVPIGDPRFMPAGTRVTISNLSRGTHKFMCLIHPWMRSTVTQR
jgi:hypothetical protein